MYTFNARPRLFTPVWNKRILCRCKCFISETGSDSALYFQS